MEKNTSCCHSEKSKTNSVKEHKCCSEEKKQNEKNTTDEKSGQEKSCH